MKKITYTDKDSIKKTLVRSNDIPISLEQLKRGLKQVELPKQVQKRIKKKFNIDTAFALELVKK